MKIYKVVFQVAGMGIAPMSDCSGGNNKNLIFGICGCEAKIPRLCCLVSISFDREMAETIPFGEQSFVPL